MISGAAWAAVEKKCGWIQNMFVSKLNTARIDESQAKRGKGEEHVISDSQISGTSIARIQVILDVHQVWTEECTRGSGEA